MSKDIRASIDKAFGFEAVLINSALVSAQNRQRLYWVGKRNPDGTYSQVHVEQPVDRGILLRDILENGVVWQEKSYNLTTRCCGAIPEDTLKRHRHTMVAEPINTTSNGKARTLIAGYNKQGIENCCGFVGFGSSGVAEPINVTADGKAQCLRATCYKDGIRNIIANEVDKKTGDVGNGGQGNRVYSVNGKAVAQTAQSGGLGPNTGLYAVPISAGNNKIILKAIDSLVDRKGFVPGMFNPYNRAEIAGKAPTLSTGSMVTSSCAVLIFETAEGKQIPAYEVHGGYITIKGKQYPIKLKEGFYIIRKLTVRECMRLQTVPEWYEFPVSDRQAYKMLGNCWTCEVIAHILKSLMDGGEDW